MNALKTYIETHRANGLPGMVIGYQYGYADAVIRAYGTDGADHPLQHDTLFPVASLTKLATALAILVLVERGNLNLDHAIGMYVADIHPDMATRRIRSLLCHTSGYGLDLATKEELYAAGLTWSVLANACVHTPPQYAAETRVQYSNVGYGILGIIIERITGLSCRDALHQLVLNHSALWVCWEIQRRTQLPRLAMCAVVIVAPHLKHLIAHFGARLNCRGGDCVPMLLVHWHSSTHSCHTQVSCTSHSSTRLRVCKPAHSAVASWHHSSGHNRRGD
jgi:hypothetical protein